MQLRFEARSISLANWIGAVVFIFSDKQKHLEKIIDTRTFGGTRSNKFHLPAPVSGQQIVRGKTLHDTIFINPRQIDLIECDDDRYICCPRMTDCLFCLWHDTVISRDHKHCDICNIRSSCSHFGKRLMPRRIDKRYLLSIFYDIVGTDVLCNSTAFTTDDINPYNRIEQRRFAMIDMP